MAWGVKSGREARIQGSSEVLFEMNFETYAEHSKQWEEHMLRPSSV